ncbi:MAG: hypothetical protein BEN18_03175 [Epulopiscium sp. Nuni2H_MBin001]|nr:MAG: hypothetical protein BEN18_03175 [Epulopiscium sp. Nuni2H_MBin001]
MGAGPAGLFAAQKIASAGLQVLLIEKNNEVGKKLLVSGSGQCNFTHAGNIEDFFDKYGDKQKTVKHALKSFDNKGTTNFFKRLGVDYEITEGGKIFPKSRKSSSILGALVNINKLNGTVIKSNTNIKSIIEYDNMYNLMDDKGNSYCCNNLIIATGGCSYPQLGANSSGHKIAKQFGHSIVEPKAALTNVLTQETIYQELSGVSFENVSLTILRGDKKIKDKKGDLLFTHKGVSGPVILNSTRWIQDKDRLVFNLVNMSYEELDAKFEKDFQNKIQLLSYFKKLELPKSFCNIMLEHIGLDVHMNCANINKHQRKKLVKYLTSLTLTVESVGPLATAMVTAGGVNTKEINPTTFESRKQKNLYFIGEVVDVDGDTGGYNIQIAFSMAYVCATHIISKR